MASGDEAEFSAFAARDGGQLLGFAFLLTGNRHDAEDLVQQALLRTAARWRIARQSPAGYSRTVVLNLVRDRWRAQQRQRAETLSPDLTQLPSAVDAAAMVVDRQVLLDACRLLPLQQRAVLVLRYWEGPVGRRDSGRARVHGRHREIPDPPGIGTAARCPG